MTLGRILCPIDFSEFSERALAQAAALAGRHGARLHLLHVAWVQVPPSSSGAAPGPLLLDSPDLAALEEDLRALARPWVDSGLPVDVRVVQGTVAARILEMAATLPVGLIVMGTHGRSGFERLMLGSTADKVVRKAPCPVLIVPRGSTEAEPPRVRFERIVYATDFSAGARAALPWALALAEEPAALTLLHVLDWPEVPEEGEPFAATLAASRDRWLEQLRPRLHEAVPARARASRAIEDVLVTGTPYKEILRIAADRRADLVVLGDQGRGAVDRYLFGSTASEVLRRAVCPVLTVRAAS